MSRYLKYRLFIFSDNFDSAPASCLGDIDPGDLSQSQFMNNSHFAGSPSDNP